LSDTIVPDPASALPKIAAVPLIGIVRRFPASQVADAVAAAADQGLTLVEVTLDSEDALGQIGQIAARVPEITVGVGSVVDVEQVDRAADAGARFVVAPIIDEATIERCLELSLPVFPGAMTPTEIARALRLGATAVKVFPVSFIGGPAYIQAIMSTLGNPRLVPTGGVTTDTAPFYLSAGAVAVGAGSDLFSSQILTQHGLGGIAERAYAWVRAVTS
jgi:2-dehydro-3-deoxyphosphogluconate aldolase/(4S)-4-hydroxy-2-oxoglutarate aldolase